MSVIYLSHPKHGNKVATDDAEAEYDKKKGWTEYTVADPKSEPVPAPQAAQKSSTLSVPARA